MLTCSKCERSYPESEPRWHCDCGSYLVLNTPGMFDPGCVKSRPPTLWRYREALGINERDVVTLGEGFTPLVQSNPDGLDVMLKLDFLCPTGSYKDRGSTVMLSKLNQWRVSRIVEDSSGNAGASVAAYAALAGIHADIYVPADASSGKIAQIAMYGANLVKVKGTREDTGKAAWDAATSTFYASHNWSPYFLAGMKTVAYEIAEQLDWDVPEWIVVPVGGGSLLVGIWLGFEDLYQAGVTARMPRLVAVQAENCAPVYAAWRSNLDDVPPVAKTPTAAEGISVAAPVRGRQILKTLRESQGIVEVVSDAMVWQSLRDLGTRGLFVEPTAAAAMAALTGLNARNAIQAGERVVVVLTGSGLKATDKIVEHFAA